VWKGAAIAEEGSQSGGHYCEVCGAEVRPEANFCPACGAPQKPGVQVQRDPTVPPPGEIRHYLTDKRML
jgi:uncharacterized OB-fold protein